MTPLAPPRAALVTGAASGIGQHAARRLAAAGTRVAAVDIDKAGLDRTAERAPSIRPWICDVGDPAAVARAVEEAEAAHGPLDRVVHAAAVCLPGSLLEQPAEEIERVLRINVMGTAHIAQAVLPRMLARGSGELVLFASLAGWLPTPRVGAYAASKAAVVAFAEVLAEENAGRGVRFACVCPPLVETPMADRMREADPRVLGAHRGIRPGTVLDAVEVALAAGDLYVFPGRGTRTIWRARRFTPNLLRWQIARATQA